MAESGKLESYAEATATPEESVSTWKKELAAAKKHYADFFKASDKIITVYRDDRSDDGIDSIGARLNFFWSNTSVLKGTLYVKPPKVDVSRVFKDSNDDVARVAGIMLERLLNRDMEADNSDFDVAIRQVIDDWLIVGSGQLWYRFEVDTEQVEVPAPIDQMTGMPQVDPATGVPVEPVVEEKITDEDVLSDYVYWKDFLCSPERVWGDVRWVARRVYMARDALVARFGEEIGKEVPVKARKHDGSELPGQSDADQDSPWATAEVWEIWCKTSKKVHWMVEGMDKFLDERDDPLGLADFFPCPQPMLANKTNNTLIPRADYSLAKDQYQQINVLVSRIKLLIDACKVRGAYDKDAAGALSSILSGNDNKMVPVDNWALFGERGGLKGVMDWVPIEQISNVLQILRLDLGEQKQQLYEVLGISDIMRGSTRASETATAQKLKAQFGSTRLEYKQFEIARFVRDAQRIKAEIISKHFQLQTIIDRSNIMHTTEADAKLAQPAAQLLKDFGVAEYRLEIEADSMAMQNWAEERESRTEFLAAIGQFVSMITPLVQAKPEAVPVMLELMSWGLGGFRISKSIEGTLDAAIQAMKQAPAPQPSPEETANLKKTDSETFKNTAQGKKALADAGQQQMETAIMAPVAPMPQPMPQPQPMPMPGPGMGQPPGV